MSKRPPSVEFQRGIRAAITWLHEEARSMNDPQARAILNNAAFGLGTAKLTFVEAHEDDQG